MVSIAATPKLEVKRLKKEGLVRELQQRRLSIQGSVVELRERLFTFLKNLEQSFIDRKVDLTKVHFSQNIEPSSIATASDSILICASDVKKTIYMVTLELNGVTIEGNVVFFCKYPADCKEVISMCVSKNVLYVSHKGVPGGVIAINMSSCAVEMVIKNGSALCVESSHITAYRTGIVYVDTGSRQIKAKVLGQEVIIIARDGKEGNCNGRAKDASFSQSMGICVELDTNIFVTDA